MITKQQKKKNIEEFVNKNKEYRSALEIKGQVLVADLLANPKLDATDIRQLNKFWNKNALQKLIEDSSNWVVGIFKDFKILLYSYKNKIYNKKKYSAYAYNKRTLSSFLHLNKKAKMPLTIQFHWNELDIFNPIYKDYSLKTLVDKTELDYIEIYIEQPC